MDEIELIKSLDRAAQRKPLPRIDVADRVAQSVRYRFPQPLGDRGLIVAAVVASMAAAAAILAAVQIWSAIQDPMGGLFHPLVTVMQ